jgi:alpha-D-xyloside xylohydrolase
MMRDYLRSLMERTHQTGEPVLRPMFYDFPEDKETWELKDQYMLGADVLVAPVLQPDCDSRVVYLPSGRWINLFTGEAVEGGKRLSVVTPADEMPVFLREGSHADWLEEIKSFT